MSHSSASLPGTRSATAPVATRTSPSGLLDRMSVVVMLGTALCFALSWPRVLDIWRTDLVVDPDDAMRLVQVRNWLGGQGWFDLLEHRLDPPAGLLMHWSRIVDVPLGALVRLCGLLVGSGQAERLARIVFPLALQVALLTATVATVRMLLGASAMVPGMVLVVLSGFTFGQFVPGRIDHHAPQITLLMAMTGTLLSALRPGRAPHAGLSGACIAVSLGISLENLPFVAVLVAVLPVFWLRDPMQARAPLLWFSASLAVVASAVFVATIPPSRYGVAAADAFSMPHEVGILVGAAGLAGLALLAGRLAIPKRRLVLLLCLAVLVMVLVLGLAPALIRDPYAGMDPLLRSLWLDHVGEAQSLLTVARTRPDGVVPVLCALLAGAGAAALAGWRAAGRDRLCWTAILALILVGLAGAVWEVRVASSTQPLALLGGVSATCATLADARRRGSALGHGLAGVLILPFAPLVLACLPIGEGDGSVAASMEAGQACRTGAALAPIAALPPGLIFAPIDDGAHLLLATRSTVIAAPYHRNAGGNRRVLDGFLAPPEDAEAIVRGAGARYLAICPREGQVATLTSAAPGGLASRLVAGEVPPWLVPVPLAGTPYRVFSLADPRG